MSSPIKSDCLHVKSGRHSSAFVCAFRQKNSKDFKVGPTMHSANDTIKSLCLCAIVPLCLAPDKTKIAKQVPAHCGQLVELLLKSDRHSSAFVGLCLCAFGQKKVYKHFIVGPTMQSANDQIRFQNGRFWRGAGSRTGGSGGGRVPGQGLCQRFWGRGSRAGPGRVPGQGRAGPRSRAGVPERVPERAVLAASGLQNGWFWRRQGSRTGGSGGGQVPGQGFGGGRLQNGRFWRWPSSRTVGSCGGRGPGQGLWRRPGSRTGVSGGGRVPGQGLWRRPGSRTGGCGGGGGPEQAVVAAAGFQNGSGGGWDPGQGPWQRTGSRTGGSGGEPRTGGSGVERVWLGARGGVMGFQGRARVGSRAGPGSSAGSGLQGRGSRMGGSGGERVPERAVLAVVSRH